MREVGFGGGTFPPLIMNAAIEAVQEGIPVVLASRSTAGRVVLTPEKVKNYLYFHLLQLFQLQKFHHLH